MAVLLVILKIVGIIIGSIIIAMPVVVAFFLLFGLMAEVDKK